MRNGLRRGGRCVDPGGGEERMDRAVFSVEVVLGLPLPASEGTESQCDASERAER